MLPKHLQGFAFRRLKTSVILFIIFLFFLLSLNSYENLSSRDEDKQKQGFKVLQETLENLKNKISKSESSLKLWNDKIRKAHSDRSGLKINQAKPIIDELKKTNYINNLVVNISNPELRPDFQDAKFCSLTYSNVTVSFSSFNDVDSLRFINSMIHELPGHVQVKALTINASPNIDDTLLADIASGRFFDVVTVKVDILWQDIVDKSAIIQPTKPKTEAGTKPQPRGNLPKGGKK